MTINISEDEVKNGVEEYLQFAMNQGKLWYCRLNAGNIYIPNEDGSHRLFKGVKKGTADFLVIHQLLHRTHMIAIVTFIECKSTKGKQRVGQKEFEEQIVELGCQYEIVRKVDDLIEVLSRK